MHNRQLLIGVVVSISDPEVRSSTKGKKRPRVVLTLDVSNGTESKVDSIPIEFWGRNATNIKRDIVPGDTISVIGIVTDETDGTLITTRMVGWQYQRHVTANEGVALGRVTGIGKLVPVQLRCGDRWRQKYRLTFMLVVYVHHKYKYYLRMHIFGKDWAKQWKKRLRVGQLVSVTYRLSSYQVRGGGVELMPIVRHMEMCDIPIPSGKRVTPKTVWMTKSLMTWNRRTDLREEREAKRLEDERLAEEKRQARWERWQLKKAGAWTAPDLELDDEIEETLDDGEAYQARVELAGADLLSMLDEDDMEEVVTDDD